MAFEIGQTHARDARPSVLNRAAGPESVSSPVPPEIRARPAAQARFTASTGDTVRSPSALVIARSHDGPTPAFGPS